MCETASNAASCSHRAANRRPSSWRKLRAFGGFICVVAAVASALPRARAQESNALPQLLSAGVPAESPRLPELSRFYGALSALAHHQRSDSVRIWWLGDSHTASDFWTGAVRSALIERYGSGGPGFLRLGVPLRHDLATFERNGRFRIEPESPARRSPQDNGVFGPGGMRVTPLSPGARLSVRVSPQALRGRARFTLLYDFKQPGDFVVRLGAASFTLSASTEALHVPGSPILRRTFEGSASDVFSIEARRGKPRFYGVYVEGTEAGVVLDTFGINGARIATALAWAEAPFVAEVSARNPDLVVVAFGTNEAFDELRVSAYDAQLKSLLARLRQRGTVDCLVLGPPDAMAPGGEPVPRVSEITQVYAAAARSAGCAFVSAQALMGGPGSFQRWQQEEPQLASADRIHLTPKGYRKLGELTLGALFGGAAEPLSVLKNSP
jgi:lysophospholipase L1-like esterase